MASPRRHRRAFHHAQQFGQWPARLGANVHHGVGQVGNLRLHLAELHSARAFKRSLGAVDAHGCALKHQFACQVFQGGPRQFTLSLQTCRHIVIGDIFYLCCYAESALPWLGEWHVVQVTLHLEIHARGFACHNRVTNVVACLRRNNQRQVAVHTCAVCPVQLAAQVKHPRKARASTRGGCIAGMPTGAQFTFCIAVGKLCIAHLHGQLLTVHLPVHSAAQARQRQPWVFKNTRQQQRAVGNGHGSLATRLRHVQIDRGTAQAERNGHGSMTSQPFPVPTRLRCNACTQFQTGDAGARLVAVQPIGRPLPGRLQAFNLPFGRIGLQGLVRLVSQRQALGNARQRGQVHAVSSQVALGLPIATSIAVLHLHIAARPAHAVVGHKSQPLRCKLEAIGNCTPGQPTLQAEQHQRAEPIAQRGVDVFQRHVGSATDGSAALHIHPGAQCAPATGDRLAKIGVGPQARHIHPRKLGKGLAAPLLPMATAQRQQRLAKLAHQQKALPPFGRW